MALQPYVSLALTIVQDRDAKEAGEYILDSEEVARILDRRPQDVRRLAREGELRARRIGTRWRFRHDDVLAYLARLSQIDKSI